MDESATNSCFNEARSFTKSSGRDSFRGASQHLLSYWWWACSLQTFLAQNYVIPSGSMENTLLVGDHLVVDQITLMPPASWMPLIRYREPRRGDIVVFHKPVNQPGIDATDADGTPQYTPLVKRLIGVPGDHIHLRNGIVIVNRVAQPVGFAQPTTTDKLQRVPRRFPRSTSSWGARGSRVMGRELPELYPGRRL